VVSVALLVGFRGDGDPVPPEPVPPPPTTTTAAPTTTTRVEPPPEPVAAVVADAVGSTVELFDEPGVPHDDRPEMANPTHEGLPVIFLVLEERPAWLRVQVSMRPNGLELWVRRDQVAIRTVAHRIEVRLAEHRLLLHRGGEVVLDETVAVGSARTPTPVGRFFVDGWVPLDGTGAYGSGQLSVAGFSDVLHRFGTGVGQIAIHGTNVPSLLGRSISNGCVRMDNDALRRLAALAPLGTPVDVVA